MFKFGLYSSVARYPADEGLLAGGGDDGGDGEGGGDGSDGGGTGGGDGGGDGGTDGSGNNGGDGSGDDGGNNDGGEAGKRPEHIQEQFWDADKNEIKVDDLAKSYNEIREAHNKLLNEEKGDVPEKAEEYFTNDNVKDDHFVFEGQDDLKIIEPIASDDPALLHLATVAQDIGIRTDQFTKLVSEMTIFADGLMPAPFDEEAEMETLGDKGPQLAATLKAWADNLKEVPGQNQLSEEEYDYLMAFGKPAIGIRVMNKLRGSMGGKLIPVDIPGGEDGLPSQEEWYASKPDARTDPDEYAKWQKQGEKIFGTGTGGGDVGRGVGVATSHGGQRTEKPDPGGRQTRKRV